jgi:hypothetical protein
MTCEYIHGLFDLTEISRGFFLMLKWLLIALGVGLVLGPVLWMMPSAAQSRQAKLRAHASAIGLQVKIADMPQVHRARIRKEDSLAGAMYILRHPPRHVCKNWLVSREYGGQWEDEALARVPLAQRKVLEKLNQEIPATIYGFEQNPQGIAIYWSEQGDVAAVDRCLEYLQQLASVNND